MLISARGSDQDSETFYEDGSIGWQMAPKSLAVVHVRVQSETYIFQRPFKPATRANGTCLTVDRYKFWILLGVKAHVQAKVAIHVFK